MEYLFAAFLITIALVALAGRSQSKKEEKAAHLISSFSNFTAHKKFLSIYDDSGIAIDTSRGRIAILGKRPSLIDQRDILSTEIVKDGFSLQKTNRGNQATRAAVGGALLGPIGLIVGGLTASKRTEEKVKSLSLKIRTSKISNPIHEVIFYKNPNGESLDDSAVQQQLKEMELWDSQLKALLATEFASQETTKDAMPTKKVTQIKANPREQMSVDERKKLLKAELSGMK